MTAWLKSYQAVREHPKTRKLARRKGVGGVRGAVGLLHCLWWWCLDYAPDGDLTKHDHEDIAIGCEWDGDPEQLIGYLIECGFLDNGGGLHVHDWQDYAGALVERRERNAQRMKDARAANVHGTCDARAGLERERDREKERASARAAKATEPRARAQEPVDNSKKPICAQCDAEMAYDGDGTAKMHCPVCGASQKVAP